MSSQAVRNLFTRLERQKIASVVGILSKAGNPGLTKNSLIKHATLEFVEQVLYQYQAAKFKRQEEIRTQAEQAMNQAQALKKERLENANEQKGETVDPEGTVSTSESSSIPVSET